MLPFLPGELECNSGGLGWVNLLLGMRGVLWKPCERGGVSIQSELLKEKLGGLPCT